MFLYQPYNGTGIAHDLPVIALGLPMNCTYILLVLNLYLPNKSRSRNRKCVDICFWKILIAVTVKMHCNFILTDMCKVPVWKRAVFVISHCNYTVNTLFIWYNQVVTEVILLDLYLYNTGPIQYWTYTYT